jgi:hypothetical protein
MAFLKLTSRLLEKSLNRAFGSSIKTVGTFVKLSEVKGNKALEVMTRYDSTASSSHLELLNTLNP